MKHRGAATVFVIALTFAFCSCQLLHKKESSPEGKWKIDTIYARDEHQLSVAILNAMKMDTTRIDLEFRKDSLFSYQENTVDTTLYNLPGNGTIVFENDTLTFKQLNDSTILLTDHDSTLIYLKKRH